tara:strand:+ start:388 stop:690 length:303 start_codon:yes stop_codon:yes gene_type:complete
MEAYPQTSPYYLTNIANNEFLDIMIDRVIPRLSSDIYWTITQTYNMRPDLLAYDLYGDSRLWWVFIQRNPNGLNDPIFDFTAGKSIYLPQSSTLKTTLGI